MGSQWRAGVRRQTSESVTVLLTDDSLLSEIDDIADESLWSSRIAADGDTLLRSTCEISIWTISEPAVSDSLAKAASKNQRGLSGWPHG